MMKMRFISDEFGNTWASLGPHWRDLVQYQIHMWTSLGLDGRV